MKFACYKTLYGQIAIKTGGQEAFFFSPIELIEKLREPLKRSGYEIVRIKKEDK